MNPESTHCNLTRCLACKDRSPGRSTRPPLITNHNMNINMNIKLVAPVRSIPQRAPGFSWQVRGSQQSEGWPPVSHCSPGSTIPLPQEYCTTTVKNVKMSPNRAITYLVRAPAFIKRDHINPCCCPHAYQSSWSKMVSDRRVRTGKERLLC